MTPKAIGELGHSSETTRPKIFKLTRLRLPANASVTLGGTVSFATMTTRRPYPGRHRIDILANGCVHRLVEFDVLP